MFTHTLNGRYEIFRVDPEDAGSVPQPIVAGRESSVSNDGTIVFRAAGDQDGLWKVGREGQRPIELAKGSVSYPFISADGRRVVFSSRLGGPQTIWQVPTDGGAATQVLDRVVGINSFSDIAPDGKSVIFAAGRDQWMMCELPACTDQRAVGPLRGLKPGAVGGKPRWAADGRSFTYLDSFDPSNNLWEQRLDASAPRQLTHFSDGKTIGHYAWSRDGRRLAMSRATQSKRHRPLPGAEGRQGGQVGQDGEARRVFVSPSCLSCLSCPSCPNSRSIPATTVLG